MVSTLLGRMLNMHSRVLCVGETMLTKKSRQDGRGCYCGIPIPECYLWKQYLTMLESVSSLNFRKFTPKLYKHIGETAGKEIIVDLSKTLVWRLTRWLANPSWWRYNGVGYIF